MKPGTGAATGGATAAIDGAAAVQGGRANEETVPDAARIHVNTQQQLQRNNGCSRYLSLPTTSMTRENYTKNECWINVIYEFYGDNLLTTFPS